jgi:uracil-DNA glycosylase
MHRNLHATWLEKLREEFEQPYFRSLEPFVDAEYSNSSCYPAQENIFKAFNHCHFNKIKVVIIGQDPYHGKGQANGLCFSVQEGVKHPPSLINIFKELQEDLEIPYPNSGNLERWARQGVLLLNATLTVRESEAGSHQKKGWEQFTDAVINKISTEKEGVIFLLWGGYAKKKGKNIDTKKHHILSSGHPSPLSANRGFWFGNKHFSKTNLLLKASAQVPIEW